MPWELTASVLARPAKMCNFIEWQDKKVVYKRCVPVLYGVWTRMRTS